MMSTRIKHALCTEYDVGAGIGWHRDKKHACPRLHTGSPQNQLIEHGRQAAEALGLVGKFCERDMAQRVACRTQTQKRRRKRSLFAPRGPHRSFHAQTPSN
jgi:hypothetical protein